MEVTIRPATLNDCMFLAKILIGANEQAFRGHVPDNCLDDFTVEESAANWQKNFDHKGYFIPDEHLLVATQRNYVVGYILSSTLSELQKRELPSLESYSKELRSISIDPRFQKQGIGRKLVNQLASLLLQEDERRLLVRCLKDNLNCVFYEQLGATKLGRLPFTWEGYETEEILFGWSDISRLANRV